MARSGLLPLFSGCSASTRAAVSGASCRASTTPTRLGTASSTQTPSTARALLRSSLMTRCLATRCLARCRCRRHRRQRCKSSRSARARVAASASDRDLECHSGPRHKSLTGWQRGDGRRRGRVEGGGGDVESAGRHRQSDPDRGQHVHDADFAETSSSSTESLGGERRGGAV